MTERKKIIVVGAGISGLSAAWECHKRGFQVQVLEAASEVGGRMGERKSGPIVYNTGARLVYPFGRDFNKLVGELGLRNALVPVKNLSATCSDAGGEYPLYLMPGLKAFMARQLTWADRFRLIAYAAELLARRVKLSPDELGTAIDEDSVSLADFVRGKLGERFLNSYIDPLFRGTRSWNPEEVSAAFLSSTLAYMIGTNTVYVFREGMGQLPAELARRVPVTLDCRVLNVSREAAGGCRIDCLLNDNEQTINADIVLMATEGNQLSKLVEDPLPEEKEIFSSVTYNSLGVVHYAIDGDIAPVMKFFPRDGKTRLSTYQQLPCDPAQGRAISQLYCQLTPEAVREAVSSGQTGDLGPLIRGDVRAVFPELDSRCSASVTQWIANKLPVPSVGYGDAVRQFLAWQGHRPRDIYYCGDYLAQALVTGAVHSGVSVAKTICRHHI